MIGKWLMKFKRVICFIVMICVMIPFASACDDVDNGLVENKSNSKIGVGGNIAAYTTYRTAPLKMMTQNLYYSYLMNYRPFILVVVPDSAVVLDAEGNVSQLNDNYMLNAAAAGVFQYDSSYSSYIENELKVLMYYAKASEFKKWEKDNGFIANAYDFTKGSENSSEFSPRNFKCDKIVNMGSNLANEKVCNGSESIFNNIGEGIVLLYGEGSLEGYIKDKDIRDHIYSYEDISNKIHNLIPAHYKNVLADLNLHMNLSQEEKSAAYKAIFDIAILSRISNLNKFTKLDFSTGSSSNQAQLNEKYKLEDYEVKTVGLETMSNALYGKGEFEGTSYIALVTADGFIYERGDIVSNGVLGTLSEEYRLILEELMRLDACPNEKIGSMLLSSGSIIAGGSILAASLFVTPIPGFRIAGLALLATGIIIKALQEGVGSSATDMNYCEIYKEVLNELKQSATFAVPVIQYNIESSETDIYICPEEGDCDKPISLYHYANLDAANKLNVEGMPYLAFYHNGKLVDSICGAADSIFISEILSSWGVMVAADNKYFSKFNSETNELAIVDRGRTGNTRTSINYCYSFEYLSSDCIMGSRALDNINFNEYNNYTTINNLSLDENEMNRAVKEYVNDNFDLDDYLINVNSYITRINNSTNFDEIHEELQRLIQEIETKANADNKVAIKANLLEISNYIETQASSISDMDMVKEYVVNAIKTKLANVKYYNIEVPVYINITVTEDYDVSVEEIKDSSNNKCSIENIRVNKIWGNYMCSTDFKWYHLESNWVSPGTGDVESMTSTEYKNYYEGLVFNFD